MRKINLLWIAMMAVGLTSCTQDDDLTGLAGSTTLSGSVITEISSSSNAASTRFDGSTGNWEESDAIGVYLYDSSNANALYSDGSNAKFTLTDGANSTSGTFTNSTGITYPTGSTSMIFNCYYPYKTDMSTSYTLDVTDQSEGYKNYELMYGSTSITGDEVTASGVSVSFKHKVAKATIYVTPQTGETVSSVTISGLPATATFAPVGGNFEASDSTGDITAYSSDSEGSTDSNGVTYYTYEAIILPSSDISKLSMTFVSNDVTYYWSASSSDTQIQAGYEYVFYIGLETTPSVSGGSTSEEETTQTGTLYTITGETPGVYEDTVKMTGEEGEIASEWSQAYAYDSNVVVYAVSSDADDLGTVLNNIVTELSSSSSEESSSSNIKTRSDDSSSTGYSVALLFDSSITYNDFSAFSVPSSISTLMLICDSAEGQASIKLTGLSNNSTSLESIYFYNIEIEGDGSGTSFIYNNSISDIIKAESCTFKNMANMFYLNNSNDTMDEITFSDCVFTDVSCIVSTLGSSTNVTNGINFTNCTVGTNSESYTVQVVYCSNGGSDSTLSLTNCTLHINNDTAFRFGYSKLCFTNCIVALASTCTNLNYQMNVYVEDESSYLYNAGSASFTYYSSYQFNSIANWSDVFTNEEYTADYTLTTTYASKEVGDPRWYSESE